MKATEAKLLDFLKKSPQFVIPIYQRTYSWTEKECEQLWDDILRAGSNEKISAHFVGSIVYIEKSLYQVTTQSPLLVIDGQQRLTTISLLLAALAETLEKDQKNSEPVDGFAPRKLRNYYLLNTEEEGDRRFKLILSQTDKTTLTAIVGQSPMPNERSIRVEANYELFKTALAKAGSQIDSICRGLAKLMVVDIALSRDQDNPQLIFESMNSTGRELTQADLIRNYILMGLEQNLQTRLYEQIWRPMEQQFGQEAYGLHFDGFVRHFLTVKTGEIPNIGAVYEEFKKYSQRPDVRDSGVESLLKEIKRFAGYFCAMALGSESDPKLKMAFEDLRELRVDVSYPFLLEVYNDYEQKLLSVDEFESIVRLIESYVFRRAISAIPTNSLNKTFATFPRVVRKDRYLESVAAGLQLAQQYRRFPNDEEFAREIKTRDLYNFRSRSYWLRRIENHDRKERVPVDEYTIEHILPQNENLPIEWRKDLGTDWKRVQKDWLHTLGNLTLTGYNSEYRDSPFSKKRDMKGGFKESPIRLNEGLAKLERWDEEQIKLRARKLSERALKVWVAPNLSEDVLKLYATAENTSALSIDDYDQFKNPGVRKLFEEFSKEVLSFDPNVTREFLKYYIAFKAETNFVDVIPQAKRLRLTINMQFADIVDPRGICEDVTGLGRWGNGNIQVTYGSLDDLPYILGLVRQSLERQLGDAGN